MRNSTLLFMWLLIMVSNLAISQTWKGTTSSAWGDATNWDPASVPGASSTVTIPGTLEEGKPWPVLSVPVNIANLNLETGSHLNLNGQEIIASGYIRIIGATVTNSGGLQAGGNQESYIRTSEFGGNLVVKITGSGTFNETDATGGNTYNGNATFQLGSGTANISAASRSLFKGDLTIERTASGTTNILTSNTETEVGGVEGDLAFVNHWGGTTTIGGADNKTILGGEINIDFEATAGNQTFTLRRLDNSGGAGGGNVSILNPGIFTVTNNTLKVQSFTAAGKQGGGATTFDENVLTVSGSFNYEDNVGNSQPTHFSRTVVNGPASFILKGSGAFYETFSGLGPNTFNGPASFTATGGGALNISGYYKSAFKGNLSVSRTGAGSTNIFNVDGTNAIEGNFSYVNKVGGATSIGFSTGKTEITGKVDIDYESGSHHDFSLRRLENAAGGGTVSIANPAILTVTNNKLTLAGFTVTGKQGGGATTFDENVLTVSGSFNYEDNENNNQPTRFSGSEVNGPASFTLKGSGTFSETFSASGPNTFNGLASFTATGTGELNISGVYKSAFNGGLSVARTGAGATDIFNAAGTNTIAGNFSYVNKAGGTTNIGVGAGKTEITGKVDIDYESGANQTFTLRRLDNSSGSDEGSVSIQNPGIFTVTNNTLKVQSFTAAGKQGGGATTFDENVLTFSGSFNYEDNVGNSQPTHFSRTVVNGPASFILKGSGAFYETFSGLGPNTFNGPASFTATGGGALNISGYYKSAFKGNLSVERTGAGSTNIFNVDGENAIEGNFSYVNKVGGATSIGFSTGKTEITGKVDIDYESGSHHDFSLRRLENAAGGGTVSIANPAILTVTNNKLTLAGFTVTGKQGGGATTFDENVLTVSGSFNYEDNEGNNQPTRFSGSEVNGPASFTLKGSGTFSETFSASGPNTFNGPASFTATGTGELNISGVYKSAFNGGLSVARTGAGATDIFNAVGENAIAGNFSYVNKVGGATAIGAGTGKTSITGKVDIDYESGTHHNFSLSRLENAAGGGTVSIANPAILTVTNNKLTLAGFTVTGKQGGGATTFDENVLTVPDGFTYEDNGGNNQSTRFSGSVVNGPASFTLKGSGIFYDTFSGLGPNQYNGNVIYTREGSGAINIGNGHTVSYAANLTFATATGISVAANRVRFNGATDATFTHAGVAEPILPGFILEKSGGAKLVLTQPLRVSNTLDFISGYIQASAEYPLIFQPGAGHTNAGDDSHVLGPVHKIGNTEFVFPTGSGTKLFLAGISAPSGATSGFSAEYLPVDPADNGYNTGNHNETLTKVFDEGYWDIRRIAGESAVTVTLGYNFPDGYITDPSKLAVAHWKSGTWNDLGNGAHTDDLNVGTVTTLTTVSDFSPFTLASTDSNNPLPVTLADFSVAAENGTALIRWSTASETGVSHFEIERSGDAHSWQIIGSVKASGESAVLHRYSFPDPGVAGMRYYRLRMVDLDGTFAYGPVGSLRLEGPAIAGRVYPNPAVDRLTLDQEEKADAVKIFALSGTEWSLKRSDNGGGRGLSFDVSHLPAGIYLLRIESKDGPARIHRVVISR